jgi:ABC-type dipeptide/oligopeptide/nickel transport system permease subunit
MSIKIAYYIGIITGIISTNIGIFIGLIIYWR